MSTQTTTESKLSGCPQCGRKDLRTLTWRELGINETSLACWDCDWVTFPVGVTDKAQAPPTRNQSTHNHHARITEARKH